MQLMGISVGDVEFFHNIMLPLQRLSWMTNGLPIVEGVVVKLSTLMIPSSYVDDIVAQSRNNSSLTLYISDNDSFYTMPGTYITDLHREQDSLEIRFLYPANTKTCLTIDDILNVICTPEEMDHGRNPVDWSRYGF
jgi:hypothetical protein